MQRFRRHISSVSLEAMNLQERPSFAVLFENNYSSTPVQRAMYSCTPIAGLP